jgi:hypothetical protein
VRGFQLSVILAAQALLAAGCASSSGPNAATVAASLEASQPGCRLDRDSRVSLAGLKLAAVKTLVRLAGDAEDAAEILHHITRVEVATYRVSDPNACGDLTSLFEIERELTDRGWWPMVTERGDVGGTRVFAHGDRTGDCDGDLDGLYVIDLDGDELEIVRLEGQIEHMLAVAVADEPETAARLIEPRR